MAGMQCSEAGDTAKHLSPVCPKGYRLFLPVLPQHIEFPIALLMTLCYNRFFSSSFVPLKT